MGYEMSLNQTNVPEKGEISALSLDITHECNADCRLCFSRLESSDYNYLTKDQYEEIAEALNEYNIHRVELVGGEPLCHQGIEWLISRVANDLQPDELALITNGSLLDNLTRKYREKFTKISISEYPNFNNDIVSDYKDEKNVMIKPYRGMLNPYEDPDLARSEAKLIESFCPNKSSYIKITGSRIYQCCLSEMIERCYNTDQVHCEVKDNWEENYEEIETWKACKHCPICHSDYRYMSMLGQGYGPYINKLLEFRKKLKNEIKYRPVSDKPNLLEISKNTVLEVKNLMKMKLRESHGALF